LDTLLDDDHPFCRQGWNPEQRRKDLMAMNQYKVELEALHFKGMDFLSKFVLTIIQAQEEAEQYSRIDQEEDDDSVPAPLYII
jgi:hypothetical protein